MDPKQVEVLDQAEHEPQRWPAWKRWLCTLLVIGAGCGCVVGYLFVKNIAIPTRQHAERVERAEAMFKERCKRSGVFIHRTVQDVEEILLINVRDSGQRSDQQFVLWDPYGDEPGDLAYIGSFLDDPEDRIRPSADGAIVSPTRYRAVFAELPGKGLKRFRNVPRDIALHEWPSYREPENKEIVEHSTFLFSGQPVSGPTPRFGVRFQDISTREERNHWIAGSSLQVLDLQTDEVIAERIGYLWDAGLGDRAGGRSPWALAADHACPDFRPGPGMGGFTPPQVVQDGQAFRFVSQVLIPRGRERSERMNTLTLDDTWALARLQMAAEANLPLDPFPDDSAKRRLADRLRVGNRWSSKTTASDAQLFVNQWTVQAQTNSDRSGFSGTVFRNLQTQQTVISLRSTEFIDDAVRDNLATNALEIRKTGFAWGQLADLQNWYGELKQQGLVEDGKFTLTGYSLGGHLATAFNLMNPTAAAQTVTFNGAGIGQVKSGTLAEALKDFEQLRASPHLILSRLTASEREAALYRDLRAHLADGSWTIEHALLEIDARFPPSQAHDPGGRSHKIPYTSAVVDQLRTSLREMILLRDEIARLKEVTAGDQRPHPVPASEVAALDLDYRMAVGLVGTKTRSASSAANLKQAYGERAVLAVPEGNAALANQFDVTGDTSPSMVANCQWHYGQEVRVPIENQPSYRGGIGRGVVDASIRHGDVKLLVNDFDRKDFGDTHSLVLLVDSLAVQRTLCGLLPETARDGAAGLLSTMMKRASSLRAEDGSLLMGSGQGKAEGDMLENVTNALAALCLGPTGFARLKGNPEGGTWADVADRDGYSGRESLHALLKRIGDSPVYQALKEASSHLRFGLSDRATGDAARKDFGAFAALFALSPFTLSIDKAMSVSAALSSALAAAWGDHFSMWQEDQPVRGREPIRNVSHDWIEARSEMLELLMTRNEANERGPSRTGTHRHFQDLHGGIDFHTTPSVSSATVREMSDVVRRLVLQPHIKQVKFGGADAEEINGRHGADRLFGGAGNDRLVGDDGADHLEGGAGDDLLDGGAGVDLLIGGPGDDTYRVTDGDVIVDKDGLGRIILNGRELGGLAKPDGRDRWVGSQKENYVRAGRELHIELEGARITVKAPLDGEKVLGIELSQSGAEPRVPESIGGNGDDNFVKDVNLPSSYQPRWVFDEFGRYDAGGWTPMTMTRETHPHTLVGQDVPLLIHKIRGANASTAPSLVQDRLHGGGGNDWVLSGGGNDEVDGGDGDDVIYGEQGHDHLSGGAGNDLISGDNLGYLAVLSVGHGDDVLDGGEGDDVVVGNGGADIIDGGAGDDILFGDGALLPAAGHGADDVRGGAGRDQLFGNGGNDRLAGEAGDDVLVGGSGADHLSGGDGDDRLIGDEPETSMTPAPMMIAVRGNQHAAVVFRVPAEAVPGLPDASPGGSDDTLFGGAGDDRLQGGRGDDRLEGGLGSDVYTRALGDGHDVLRETADPAARDVDVLRLDASLPVARTSVERVGEDLLLRWSGSDSVLIEGQFAQACAARIERVEFADGSSWSHEALVSRARWDPEPAASGADRDERGALVRHHFMSPRLERMDPVATVADIDWRQSRFVVDGAFAHGPHVATPLQTRELEPGRAIAWVGFHAGAYTKAVRLEVVNVAHGGLAAHVTDAKFADGDVTGAAFDWESAGTRTQVAVSGLSPGYGLATLSLAVNPAAQASWPQAVGLPG